MEYARHILITGGAGFIGSHVVRRFVEQHPDFQVINLDALTYAGNLANLTDLESAPNYCFIKGNVCDTALLKQLFENYLIDGVIHLAAESHVDRSIHEPFAFEKTNVLGTLTLLEAARKAWGSNFAGKRFLNVSTDEVYGSLQPGQPAFKESNRYQPHSPYAASKACADHFARAYHDTYGLPLIVTNCSNNYGPNQFPEKLIPLTINNILHNRNIPVYGTGQNVRDWLFVTDHAAALEKAFLQGVDGETYNIGGSSERRNIEIVEFLIKLVDNALGRPVGASKSLISYVTDRAGHDLRYAIDSSKIQEHLGWKPQVDFEQGMALTVQWYLDNQPWLDNVTSGAYVQYYDLMYKGR